VAHGEIAKLPHPQGGCSFSRHGTYNRVTPAGIWIPRCYYPEGHRHFNLSAVPVSSERKTVIAHSQLARLPGAATASGSFILCEGNPITA
jgi:hypothetical protein